jgi:hypothetical protein
MSCFTKEVLPADASPRKTTLTSLSLLPVFAEFLEVVAHGLGGFHGEFDGGDDQGAVCGRGWREIYHHRQIQHPTSTGDALFNPEAK